ncbi:hypothetical protein EWM64_g9850 [Hericium alpestre]|uniref:Uncharacterized protein n=1 Tax=Hericium alpestre TaxID=135208 RepID=A0A4Y9ZJU7_9AGAM|nr:hypothetical protein EWM64_g9850 [Hericium alpestre]
MTVTSTLPGDVTTIQVPFIITHIVTDTEPTLTLFASCGSSSQGPSTPPPQQPPSQSPNSASAANSGTSLPAVTQPPVSPSDSSNVLTTSTPPPIVVTEQTSSTLDNGSVVVLFSTITSSPPPTAVYVPKTPAPQPAPSPNQDGASQGSSSNLAPILAGVIPGFFGLFGIVGLICRRRKRYGDLEEEEVVPYPVTRVKDRHRELDLAEPKPYEYGLVGHANSVATSASPPTTPAASSNLNHLRSEQRDSSSSLDYFGFVSEGNAEAHGSPRSVTERRELQVVNSPTSTVLSLNDSPRLAQSFPGAGPSTLPPPLRPEKSSRPSRRVSQPDVIVHRDGGRVPDDRVSVTSPSSQAGGSPSPVVGNQELPPPEYRE